MNPVSHPAPCARPLILVGTDFSQAAAHAFAEARVLALRLRGSLRLLHVAEQVAASPWRPDGEAEAWLVDVGTEASLLETRRGTPWVELARFASDCGAALVVVGTHGRTGFQTVALGTTATRLTLLSPRPVLLVSGRPSARAGAGANASIRAPSSPVPPRRAARHPLDP